MWILLNWSINMYKYYVTTMKKGDFRVVAPTNHHSSGVAIIPVELVVALWKFNRTKVEKPHVLDR
jgi:hypothetical protein